MAERPQPVRREIGPPVPECITHKVAAMSDCGLCAAGLARLAEERSAAVAELPNWVYDVIIDLERWRDEHPRLYAIYAGRDEYQKVDDCGCRPLDRVPPDVLARAQAIREYLRGVTVVREGPATFTLPRAARVCTCMLMLGAEFNPRNPDCSVHGDEAVRTDG